MGTNRTSLIAIVVALGCTALVIARAATSPRPPVVRAATASERAQLAQTVAAQEPSWTMETTQGFPADNWSQRDDFSGKEYRKVQQLAKDKHLRIEDVLRGVDDDIHRITPRSVNGQLVTTDRHADAVPCKPRPFYD